jgi:hypothetical protein
VTNPFHQELRRIQIALAVDAFYVGGPSAPDLVDHVDSIALSEEILRPPVAPVRGAREIRPAHCTARNHHEWEAVGAFLWNLVFDIGMTRHHLAVRRVEILSADKEIALLCNNEQTHTFGVDRSDERGKGCGGDEMQIAAERAYFLP